MFRRPAGPLQDFAVGFHEFFERDGAVLFGTASSMLVSLAPTMLQLSSTSQRAIWCFLSMAFSSSN